MVEYVNEQQNSCNLHFITHFSQGIRKKTIELSSHHIITIIKWLKKFLSSFLGSLKYHSMFGAPKLSTNQISLLLFLAFLIIDFFFMNIYFNGYQITKNFYLEWNFKKISLTSQVKKITTPLMRYALDLFIPAVSRYLH